MSSIQGQPAPFFGQAPNVLRAEAVKRMLQLGLAGAGVGAAYRGVQGLGDLVAGTLSPPPKVPVRQQFVTVPVGAHHRRDEDEEKVGAWSTLANKAAEVMTPDAGTTLVGHGLNWLGQMKLPDSSNWQDATGAVKNLLWNPQATSPSQIPLVAAGGLAAVGGGLYAGHALADRLVGGAKARETDSELENARREYEKVLASGVRHKRASAPDALDRLYDRIYGPDGEKRADSTSPVDKLATGYLLARQKQADLNNAVNPLVAAYLMAAGGVGLGAGKLTYDYFRNRSESKATEDALRKRRETMFAAGPPPIVAVPQPGYEAPKQANLGDASRGVLGGLDAKQKALQEQVRLQVATAVNGGVPPDPPKQPKATGKPLPPKLPSVVPH